MKTESKFKMFSPENPYLPISEVAGMSKGEIRFPITTPIANFLSINQGSDEYRARILNWILTDGLMHASQNREKLLQLVQAQLQKPASNITPFNRANVQPTAPSRKVAGMQEMARQVVGAQGVDPDNGEITSHDLFSPEAWKEKPELASVRIDGKSITEWFEEHGEPTTMVIEFTPGAYRRINIRKGNALLESFGLEPFKYGGFDGYIQYVEKGSYMPSHQRRGMYAPNDQHGVDLRPEKKFDRSTGRYVDVEDIRGFDSHGNPLMNFMGGASSADVRRASRKVSGMRADFTRTIEAIKNGQGNHGLSPEQVETYKSLLDTSKLLTRMEQGVFDKGAGRKSAAAKLGIDDYGGNEARVPLPDLPMPQELFIDKVSEGISQVNRAKANKWQHPEKFGPEWNGVGEPPRSGFFRIQGDHIIFRLNPKQQSDVLSHIFSSVDRDGMINARFELQAVPSLREAGPVGVTRWNVSSLFNKGAKANKKDLEGMKMVMYHMRGIDPRHFVADQDYHKIEVDPYDEQDPTLVKLIDNGYRWELNTPREKALQKPDFDNRPQNFLTLKGSRYKVERNEKDGKFYLSVPLDRDGKPVPPSSYGKTGQSWLGATKQSSLSGGIGGGHVNSNPAGPKTWAHLEKLLLAGELGEPDGPHSSLTELPCIRKGVAQAESRYRGIYQFAPTIDKTQLIVWGIEALKSFSNDPAFQVGYVTQDEVEKILSFDSEEESQIEKEFEKKGRGVKPLLHRHGLTQPDAQDDLINHIASQFGKKPIIDYDAVSPEHIEKVKAAFGENAFLARTRIVANYVFQQMGKESKQDRKLGVQMSAITDKDDEGRGGDMGPGQDFISNRGTYDSGVRKVVQPADFLKDFGIQSQPQAPASVPTPNQYLPPKPAPVAPSATTQSDGPDLMNLDDEEERTPVISRNMDRSSMAALQRSGATIRALQTQNMKAAARVRAKLVKPQKVA